MGHGSDRGGGCGGHDEDNPGGDEQIELGPPTGATCPPGSTLSYESFGRPFVEKYCTGCHASTLVGAARNGATPYHDFDSLEGIRVVAGHVDQMAGSGPDATNTQMPPLEPRPSLEERQQLSEWLACGAP